MTTDDDATANPDAEHTADSEGTASPIIDVPEQPSTLGAEDQHLAASDRPSLATGTANPARSAPDDDDSRGMGGSTMQLIGMLGQLSSGSFLDRSSGRAWRLTAEALGRTMSVVPPSFSILSGIMSPTNALLERTRTLDKIAGMRAASMAVSAQFNGLGKITSLAATSLSSHLATRGLSSIFGMAGFVGQYRAAGLLDSVFGPSGMLEAVRALQSRLPRLSSTSDWAVMTTYGERADAVLARLTGPPDAEALLIGGAVDDAEDAEVDELPAPPPQIIIEHRVRCWFCGSPVKAKGDYRWVGATEGFLDILVVPGCPTCVEHEQREPGYLALCVEAFEASTEVARPVLSLISGDAAGDLRPRATLRLVERPASDDDDR